VTRTNIGLFKKNEMTVSRRFSDFLGLHDKLAEKYLHKGRLVPAPPEKNVVGMFPSEFNAILDLKELIVEYFIFLNFPLISGTTKVKMAGGQTEQEGKLPEFVERRRAALERYLIRTAIHPIFQVDPDFREFLECGMFKLYSMPQFTHLFRLLGYYRRRIATCIEYLCPQWSRCAKAF